jgi:hypothetical protein
MPILGITASSILKIPPSSYESISSITAAGGESSITLSSIPGTYKSLQIRFRAKDTYTGGTPQFSSASIQFNGVAGTNYADHSIVGTGSTVYTTSTTSTAAIGTVYGAVYGPATSTFGVGIIDILDYASTTKYKTVIGLNGGNYPGGDASFNVTLGSGLFMSTSAITSIRFPAVVTSFAAGSTFSLYGIKG